jgi:biopolymer transport protein TolR
MGMSTGKSEINVTPLVDVVLVLLIIFMVTMPVLMKSEPLEVPPTIVDVAPTGRSIIVTSRPDGRVVLSEGAGSELRVFGALELPTKLRPLLEQVTGEKVVFVDFCAGTQWQDVVSTMDRVRSLGDIKVALKKKDRKSDIAPDSPQACNG